MKAEDVNLPPGLHSLTTKITINKERAELGKKLFSEKNLSLDKKISCSTCHNPETSFTINQQFAHGIYGRLGNTNPPAIFNRFLNGIQFWDGRASNLYAQAFGPLLNPNEMGNTIDTLNKYLLLDPYYSDTLRKLYDNEPSVENMVNAIVEYERTIFIGHSRYDQYMAGNKNALSPNEIKGKDLFFEKFKCQSCHSGANFTNEKLEVRCYPKFFTKLSIEELAKLKKIKVPSLRNIEKTSPYLHDGNLSTLEDVIDFYNDTGIFDKSSGTISKTITLTKTEKRELVMFLKSLTEINE